MKYDGWCLKAFGKILPWSFYTKRTDVVKWWDEAIHPSFKWERFRKRGTHKIVKVYIFEVKE